MDIDKIKHERKKRRERKLKDKRRNPVAKELRTNKLYRQRREELRRRDTTDETATDQQLEEYWDEFMGSDEDGDDV